MAQQDSSQQSAGVATDVESELALQDPIALPIPLISLASGLYSYSQLVPFPPFTVHPVAPQPIPGSAPGSFTELTSAETTGDEQAAVFPLLREQLRLDVDGRYPQMAASGDTVGLLTNRVHWIANLAAAGPNTWAGGIWYKDGNVAMLPHTQVQIQVVRSFFLNQRRARVTFTGGGAPTRVRIYSFKSPYFHPVELEFDCAQGAVPVTQVQTWAHPNRPATLANETLVIETIFRRAGFDVIKSGGDNIVPLPLAGPNAKWSNSEMHDAMQVYWSRFANRAQWSMWVFFASLSEQGTSLGGIMFDDIGPNHRQGTAIFEDSFISQAPAGDSNPGAWVQRMRFWTAVHESGHCFNLAHSWQKSLGMPYGTPWIPLADEPEARSFMNYPYRVSGGQTAFFANFDYRFSNQELLFMRHAPERFVEMGAADWFDHHGFRQARSSPEPTFKLEVRTNRTKPLFEFLEPVVLELKLTNTSTQPQLLDEDILSNLDHLTVVVKKEGKPSRQLLPYARYCYLPKMKTLAPGEASYDSLFVSAGRNGWDLAEPGNYLVQAVLHLENEDIISNPIRIRLAPPLGYDEELLAQDFFSDEVGRIFTFDGSQVLTSGIKTLREAVERFKDRRVACHARIAIGNSMTREYKQLVIADGRRDLTAAHVFSGKILVNPAKAEEARKELTLALTEQSDVAAESLGHIDYKYYFEAFTDWLNEQGASKEAVKLQDDLYNTLSKRKVLDRVLQDVKERREAYAQKKAKTAGA